MAGKQRRAKSEFLTPEGFRLDGRKTGETRAFSCRVGEAAEAADGSAAVEQGNTKVMAYVYGPTEEGSAVSRLRDSGVINCDVHMAPFCTTDRRRRRRSDRLTTELSQAIRQVFSSSAFITLYPRSSINIFVHVLELDGGLTSACINACSLALVDAGIAMRDIAVACSATYISPTPIVDANHEELQAGGAELTLCVGHKSDKAILVELNSKMPSNVLDEMYDACLSGCRSLVKIMQISLRERAYAMLSRNCQLSG